MFSDLEYYLSLFLWVGDVWIDEWGVECFEYYENYKFVVCIYEIYYSFFGNIVF